MLTDLQVRLGWTIAAFLIIGFLGPIMFFQTKPNRASIGVGAIGAAVFFFGSGLFNMVMGR